MKIKGVVCVTCIGVVGLAGPGEGLAGIIRLDQVQFQPAMQSATHRRASLADEDTRERSFVSAENRTSDVEIGRLDQSRPGGSGQRSPQPPIKSNTRGIAQSLESTSRDSRRHIHFGRPRNCVKSFRFLLSTEPSRASADHLSDIGNGREETGTYSRALDEAPSSDILAQCTNRRARQAT
jgi:hypothetical protein